MSSPGKLLHKRHEGEGDGFCDERSIDENFAGLCFNGKQQQHGKDNPDNFRGIRIM